MQRGGGVACVPHAPLRSATDIYIYIYPLTEEDTRVALPSVISCPIYSHHLIFKIFLHTKENEETSQYKWRAPPSRAPVSIL